MSVKYIIAHEPREVLGTDYFVEQLKQKWPEAKIDFISDPMLRCSNLRPLMIFGYWGIS